MIPGTFSRMKDLNGQLNKQIETFGPMADTWTKFIVLH